MSEWGDSDNRNGGRGFRMNYKPNTTNFRRESSVQAVASANNRFLNPNATVYKNPYNKENKSNQYFNGSKKFNNQNVEDHYDGGNNIRINKSNNDSGRENIINSRSYTTKFLNNKAANNHGNETGQNFGNNYNYNSSGNDGNDRYGNGVDRQSGGDRQFGGISRGRGGGAIGSRGFAAGGRFTGAGGRGRNNAGRKDSVSGSSVFDNGGDIYSESTNAYGDQRHGVFRGRGRGGTNSGRQASKDNYGEDREFNNNKGETQEDEPQKPREFYIPPEPSNNEDEIFSSGISSGINFSKYDNIPIQVSGENIPTAINTFEDAGFRDIVYENVLKSGYKVPTPIQKVGIPILNAGRDLMACAQTGSGKTASFLLPIINSLLTENCDLTIGKPKALIISPTRELSIQIFNEARKFAYGSYIRVSNIYGGTSSKHQSENIGKGCHILICTPGRLLDFIEKGFIILDETQFVVLDEADRMLDMGFKGSIDAVMNHNTMRASSERQVLMFSATFPSEIQRLAGEYLHDYIFIAIGIVGSACTDVIQKIYEVRKYQKRNKLMELLREHSDGTIVFVETKRSADFLASILSETEYPTTSIHGDRLQRQREEALSDLKSGKMKVLIATSVAARGLDIKNICQVINYDMPSSIDEYVHRIGRTGRVGNNGHATSFFDPEHDSDIAGDLVKILEDAAQEVPQFLRRCSGGGGGGGGFSKFGGRDVRHRYTEVNDNVIGAGGPDALETEENW